jgi:ATP phosphoribosyltransferase
MCVPIQSNIQSPADLRGKRVATSFPKTTQRFLDLHNAPPDHLITLNGSVEIMISLGVADAIVDLVETGSTLAANNLRILTDIGSYETILIQSPKCRDPFTADRIVRRLEGVVIARDYSLLEYNIRKEKLAEAEQVTPGFTSPTVTQLEDSHWFAVRAMVKSKDVIGIMEKLEALGAKAILETSINNCRL